MEDTAFPATSGPEHDEARVELERRKTEASEKHGDSIRPVTTRDDGTEYPTGIKLILIIVALCLAVFVMALDNSIIATAIPKITVAFNSLDDVGWYASAYLLTTAALQLFFGKLYTFLSLKWVFVTAITIFEIGSLICGVAPNSTALIVGRAIAGIGSAGIFSGALLILANSVPLPKRPAYTGILGAMYGIASVAGPLLGGVFTDKVTWRWCFYINLPIGAVAVGVVVLFFEEPQRKPAELADNTNGTAKEPFTKKLRHFDILGTAIFIPAVISLLLALQWGGTEYAWSNGRIIGLFVVFGVLFLAFLAIQWKAGDDATVPPRIIQKRSIYSGAIYAFGSGASFFLFVYYIPIWFQAVQGVSAINSGIRNLPTLLSVVVFSIFSGGLVTTFGQYAPFMILGTVLMSIGAGLLTTWEPSTTTGAWVGYQILYGAGAGMGFQQPLVAVQAVLDPADVPVGTAVMVFVQTIGGALFTSVGQNVFSNTLVTQLVKNVPSVDPKTVIAAGAANFRHVLDANILPSVVLAYSNAITTAFIVGAALSVSTVFGSVFIEWKSIKGKHIETAGG
ncbi:putative efflux pump [Xylariaceae sp. FL1651]|nr:putative efflux pump [Xylariaceae sp. FL1651]